MKSETIHPYSPTRVRLVKTMALPGATTFLVAGEVAGVPWWTNGYMADSTTAPVFARVEIRIKGEQLAAVLRYARKAGAEPVKLVPFGIVRTCLDVRGGRLGKVLLRREDGIPVEVAQDFFEHLRARHPEAEVVQYNGDGGPVVFEESGQIVALVMPVSNSGCGEWLREIRIAADRFAAKTKPAAEAA